MRCRIEREPILNGHMNLMYLYHQTTPYLSLISRYNYGFRESGLELWIITRSRLHNIVKPRRFCLIVSDRVGSEGTHLYLQRPMLLIITELQGDYKKGERIGHVISSCAKVSVAAMGRDQKIEISAVFWIGSCDHGPR